MNTIKNILVTLDLSPIDDTLITNANYLAQKIGAENVYFVHNIKKHEIYNLFEQEIQVDNLDEIIDEELNEKVSRLFTANINYEVLISDDPNTELLIEYIVQKYSIQLTLVGNKTNINGSGILANKLLKLLKCHILSIPENYTMDIKNIWIGTDFSNHSKKTFKLAEQWKPYFDFQMSVANVYGVPIQFTFVDTESVIEEVSAQLEKKAKKYLKQIGIENTTFKLFRQRDLTIAQALLENARKEKVDILLVGDKGGDKFSSLLVGSTAEDVFREAEEIAILVVK